MAQIGLVVSDIDGTVLDDQQQVGERLPLVLKKLEQKAIPFVLASARSPKGMYQIAAELGVTENPLACYNGALILKNALTEDYQPLFSHEIVRQEAQVILQELTENFPQLSVSLYSGANWYVEALDRWVKIEQGITGEQPIVEDLATLVQDHELPLHKFLVVGEPEEIQTALAFCQQLGLLESAFYLSKDNYLEITHQAVSKEKAVQELATFYQLEVADILTIGDNFNDLPMLELAGIGVAMANAPEAVRQQATYHTLSNNQDGVAVAIEKYVL